MNEIWDDIESTEDKVPRDRWQRPLIVPAKGGKPVAYTRVTTFAGSVEDMYGLGQWQQRMVAIGLSRRPDLLLSVAAHAEDRDELNRITEAAKEAAAASAAATTGSALHKLAERYDRGQISIIDVPESHRADLSAYSVAVEPFTFEGIEEFVVLDDLHVAGTFDRIVSYDGQRYVADIKTGSIDYGVGKMAVQLALYSRGQLYAPGKAERVSTNVSQTAGIIIHLPAGTGRCDLYWIDLRAGWDAVALCGQVRAWRKRSGLLAAASFGRAVLDPPSNPLAGTPYAGVTATVESIVESADEQDARRSEEIAAIGVISETFEAATVLTLDDQIATATSAAGLEALWAQHRDEWTAEHTRAAAARKLQLHQRVLKDAVSAK